MEKYTYARSAFTTSSGGVSAPGLVEECIAALGVKPVNMGVSDDNVVFEFSAAVNQTTLDSIIAAHNNVKTIAIFHASSKVVDEEAQILTADWSTVGGVVTNISFFIPDLTKALGRVVGEYKADGDGAQLRVIEVGQDGTEVEIMTPPKDLLNTDDAWTKTKFTCVNMPPRAGDSTFRIEGRLNGATSASVRFLSMSLLEIKTL